MKTTAPIETKVAVTGVSGAAVTLIIAVLQHQSWFTLTPEVVAGITSLVAVLAGWLAPHTSRTPPGGKP